MQGAGSPCGAGAGEEALGLLGRCPTQVVDEAPDIHLLARPRESQARPWGVPRLSPRKPPLQEAGGGVQLLLEHWSSFPELPLSLVGRVPPRGRSWERGHQGWTRGWGGRHRAWTWEGTLGVDTGVGRRAWTGAHAAAAPRGDGLSCSADLASGVEGAEGGASQHYCWGCLRQVVSSPSREACERRPHPLRGLGRTHAKPSGCAGRGVDAKPGEHLLKNHRMLFLEKHWERE